MKNKKLTLKDFKVTSFVTSDESKNILGGLMTGETNNMTIPCTNDKGCTGQTGLTQCKAHGGCQQATNPIACNTEVCDDTIHCATMGCTEFC